jgi:hypothetical protein
MANNAPRSYGNTVNAAKSLNNDYSSAAPSLLANLLCTLPVNAARIGYVVQQQSASLLQVVFDDGVSSTPTIVLLNPAAAGTAGDSADMLAMPHYGRIRVYAAVAGVQVGAADW